MPHPDATPKPPAAAPPFIPLLEGDGVGPELCAAVIPILTKAAARDSRSLTFKTFPAGEKALRETGASLPPETMKALATARASLKGPLATPVGGGIRSLNVAIRQALELYACVRPISHIPGVPSPVKSPEKINAIIFRENTEDVYAGLEWPAASPEAEALQAFLQERLGVSLKERTALGLKPMTEMASKRLVKMAIAWALREKLPSLTLVHKGNIMKYTEGAFRAWGYEVARDDFPGLTVPESEAQEGDARLVIKDRIADNMFMQTLLRPSEYSAIATPNLNGDYLSDCLAAQIGGLGVAPGANIGDSAAVFEATHGTAPKYAGKDVANPSSLLLSGALMFDYLSWEDSARRVRDALAQTVAAGFLTQDLARQIPGAPSSSTSAFARQILERV
ncbi:MAG: NADP-dependent isocitrate dehydrogenase [Deltaproteobacteria bacterium]|jgi:isocitrate dehydrogenase|nr:NADP-dependent isocitrate dehydrogenase [Deltaproteobacteria bacterium]